MKKILPLLFMTLTLLSCEKVITKQKAIKDIEGLEANIDLFTQDGKGGLFNRYKWYEYDMPTHLVWPLLDIYALKTPNDIYKLQIQSYYGPNTTAGIITLAYASQTSGLQSLTINASACGNPYTTPDYNECLKDPNRNAFTYVNLASKKMWMMTDADSLLDSSWDIAFKDMAIKLNSGTTGPGNVSGALVKRFSNLFFSANGSVIITELTKASNIQAAMTEFNNTKIQKHYPYVLPEGVDRVINEPQWFSESNQIRSAVDGNFWAIRNYSKLANFKFHISSISETTVDSTLNSEITVEFENTKGLKNGVQQNTFLASTLEKLKTTCLNLETNEMFTCSKDRTDWDLKLTVVNSFKNNQWVRDWRFFVNSGAVGPLTESELDDLRI